MTGEDVRRPKKTASAAAAAAGFFAHLREKGIQITPTEMRRITEKIAETMTYQPRVGVLGKTGAGKSTLCNALFGVDVAKVNDIAACTRKPQEIVLKLTPEGKGITLLDVPGVGESRERDIEYTKLYQGLLPELDIVLWVLKGDDRAFSVDQHFYSDVVLPALSSSKTPLVFVLNQVDKIEPFREWDIDAHKPGRNQDLNIKKKVRDIKAIFGVPTTRICAVSAGEEYNLVKLVSMIVRCLPDERKYGITREAKAETVSEATKREAEEGLWASTKRFAAKVVKEYIPYVVEGFFRFLFGR